MNLQELLRRTSSESPEFVQHNCRGKIQVLTMVKGSKKQNRVRHLFAILFGMFLYRSVIVFA